MSKAVLVIDMPESCADCDLTFDSCEGLLCIPSDRYFDGDDSSEERVWWCPLRPLPDYQTTYHGHVITESDYKELGKKIGWNNCLDEITGGDD